MLKSKSLEFQWLGGGKMAVAFISGAMTGIENFNREAFFKAEEELKKKGYVVLNPATLPDGLERECYLDIDFAMLRQADSIYMLKGWEKSKGARGELLVALMLGIDVLFENPNRVESVK